METPRAAFFGLRPKYQIKAATIRTPPAKHRSDGVSASSSQARNGAKGVSMTLSSAVSEEGRNLAPDSNATAARAKHIPKAVSIGISSTGTAKGSENKIATGNSSRLLSIIGPTAGVAG